ncbi:hypothetical protein ACMU_13345 [Actibacterium mucosum KCTC 23349]|uniref:Permease n=1 Tax=Actibacterium mucosum KCTC 23349 TaxID=1454373 RepID=A0A037ZJ54_9RHOB|nr:hypothetical protein ACMU_13345 [Actibacterium mucosum KCTC 23349]
MDGSLIFLIALGVAGAIGVWFLKGPDVFWQILGHEVVFAAALMPKIVAGVLIASALPFLISRDRITAAIGPESGWRGLAIAAAAGAIIPGGPSVTYPLALGLMAAGADLGAGIAIVSGWVLLGLNRTLIWELSFLPADIVALRFVLCLPFPILLGLATRKLWKDFAP